MIETEEEEVLVYIKHYINDEMKMARIKELDSGLSGTAIFTILFSCFVVVGTSAIIFNKKNNLLDELFKIKINKL